MSALPINIDGHPWSPYFVFIRDTSLTDLDILNALGLPGYVGIDSVDNRFDYLAIGRDSQWTHLADSWGYTHWFSSDFKDAVIALASTRDVFSFSVGDSDDSFDFQLTRRGVVVRHFVWDCPGFSGGQLGEEFGERLPAEDTIACGKDALPGLWRVASALGIESDYSRVPIKLYAPSR